MKATAVQNHAVPNTFQQSLLRTFAILTFTILTALAAQVKIPVPGTVVPVTLQTAIVILAGLRLGSRDGAISQALYIALGAIGLPFFAGAAGLAVLFGPTGGYLTGFVVAAWLAGALQKKFGHGAFPLARTWSVAFVASLALFVPGVIQLKLVTAVTWPQALMMGFVPFIIGDLVKVTFSATAMRLMSRYSR